MRCFILIATLAVPLSAQTRVYTLWQNKPVSFNLEKPNRSPELRVEKPGLAAVAFEIRDDAIQLVLTNKSQELITIDWDKVSLIGPSGSANRVVRGSTLVIDANRPQAPSSVPPGATFETALVPINALSQAMPSLALKVTVVPDGNCGKGFGLFLPIEVGEKRQNLSFEFAIVCGKPGPALCAYSPTIPMAVNSNPQGGVLFVDGKQIGQTPQNLLICGGYHTLRVERDGYSVWTRDGAVSSRAQIQADLVQASQAPTQPSKSPNIITIQR